MPITPLARYRGGMTEGTAEPSNADLLAFMQQAFAHLTTEVAGVKADIAGVDGKADTLAANLDGMTEELRGEIRATEARLTVRLGALQKVVQSVKGDIAAHAADPDAHHRHAA